MSNPGNQGGAFWTKLRQNFTTLSNNFDRTRGWAPKPVPKTRSVIRHTRFDDLDWRETARKDNVVDAGIVDMFVGDPTDGDEGRPGYDNSPELVRDAFLTFLKPVPTMQDKRNVEKDARLNGKFIEQMMALPEWERLHDQTMTDPVLATMATGAVIDALKEMIKQHREQVEDSNRRKRDKEGTGEGGCNSSGSNVGNNPDNSGQGQPQDTWDERPGDGGGQDEWEQQQDDPSDPGDDQNGDGQNGDGQNGQDDVDQSDLLDNIDRAWDEAYLEKALLEDEADLEAMLDSADFARGMNAALREAADEMGELDDLRRGIGVEDAVWKQMDPSARLALAERLNTPQMKVLAELVGRMKRFAMSQQAQKINDVPNEIYDVEMGNDLRSVLKSEFAPLGTEDTKVIFYKKYIERELLQFKKRGKEDVGKGPIVVAIDNSGSMSGQPENWAKAVAEALRRICAEQDRDYYAMYFETNRHRERFEFPKGKGDFEKVLKFLSVSAGGGTEFDGVLTECLARIQEQFDGESKGKGDIVFITDGEAHLDDAWIKNFVEEKKRIGCRVFGIYISAYDSEASSAMQLLKKFCDLVIKVKDLTVNDEAARQVFSQV